MEKMLPGLVVPTPKLPLSKILAASVKSPALKVEKIRSDFPVREFWVRRLVMAPVVVAAPVRSRVLKASRTAVVVAEDKLARVKGVEVAAAMEEVAVIVPKVGEVVADKVNVYEEPVLEVERSA